MQMVTIKKSCTLRERVLLIVDLLTILNSDLRPLTTGEREIILESQDLPDRLKSSPFSLAPKRYYAERLDKTLPEINRLIGQISAKGYLEEHYGEYFYKLGIGNLISLAKENREMTLQLSLIPKEDIRAEEEDVNEETYGVDKGDIEDI
jgi:hypothetical protein